MLASTQERSLYVQAGEPAAQRLVSYMMRSLHSSLHSQMDQTSLEWKPSCLSSSRTISGMVAHWAVIRIAAGTELESGCWRTTAAVKLQYHLEARW
jgi:hypothetical protein